MDGLLIDSGPVWKQAFNSVLTTYGFDFDTTHYIGTAGMRIREAVTYWSAQGIFDASDIDIVIDRILTKTEADMKTAPCMPGATEILQFSSQTAVPLALVSSSPKSIVDQVLRTQAWEQIFHIVVTGEDVQMPKPDPEAYLHTAQTLNIPIDHCLIFEDSTPGVTAAVRSGAKVIAIPKAGMETDPIMAATTYTYSSLLDISKETLSILMNQ